MVLIGGVVQSECEPWSIDVCLSELGRGSSGLEALKNPNES